jgi:hypothetical protein
VPGLDRRPRRRPGKLRADKGNDYARCPRYLRKRGITARIARKGIESKERLVGTTGSWSDKFWFGGFGKSGSRFERRLDIHKALLLTAAAIITSRLVDDLC